MAVRGRVPRVLRLVAEGPAPGVPARAGPSLPLTASVALPLRESPLAGEVTEGPCPPTQRDGSEGPLIAPLGLRVVEVTRDARPRVTVSGALRPLSRGSTLRLIDATVG